MNYDRSFGIGKSNGPQVWAAGQLTAAQALTAQSTAAPPIAVSPISVQATAAPAAGSTAGEGGTATPRFGPEAALFPTLPAPAERTLLDIINHTIDTHPTAAALDDGTGPMTYRELKVSMEGLARRLWSSDVGAGDRVGVRVPSGSADLYIAILGVLASGAAYVPVDVDEPDERARTVWEEAGVCAVIGAGLDIVMVPGVPPTGQIPQPSLDDDAWIIFTSGSTGKPKGVAITHRSAAAWADAEERMFCTDRPLGPGDRVLAGLSVAFDASCEEMWLAWRNGACLVPAPRAVVRSGADLGPWLAGRHITVVSTVPTLAALWPAEALEDVRLLIFGGEACPNELVARLAGPRARYGTPTAPPRPP